MRNVPAILAALALGLGAAHAQQGTGPLLGPGNVGEKDEKGRVKGADAGEGPNREFNQQFERRVEKKEKEEKEEKAPEANRGEANRGQTPNSGSGNTGSAK